jgi:hypothetical protein
LLLADTHAVYLDEWKLVLDRAANAWALFDLRDDPAAQRNLVDRYPRWTDELAALLDLYLAGDPPLVHEGVDPPRTLLR